MSCAAILDECRELALVDPDDLEQGRELLRRVLSLLGRAAASERVKFVADEARRRAARVA